MELLIDGIVLGLIATVAMDAWAAVARHVLHLPTSNWAMVGRWFGHMANGAFIHRPISAAPPVRHELALGWIAHYAIGLAYGLAYISIVVVIAGRAPSLTSALAFALALLVFPWLVMQPAMGAGVFASRTARPNVMRLVSLSMHTMFGLGLYLGSLAIR